MKSKYSNRNDFDFWSKISTRWIDMDGLRHINHAAYLSYMETARLNFYKDLGYGMHRWDQEISTILVSMKVEYLEQAIHPAHFDIGQRISRVGNKSFDISTAIFKEGENAPVLQAKFIMVTYDYRNNRSIPVPENFQEHCIIS